MTKAKKPAWKEPKTVFTKEERESKFAAKQSFKDQCDINRILDKAVRTGTLSHIARHEGFYSNELADFDYEAAQIQIAEANSVFYDLPAEIRAEFSNDPGAFRQFVVQNDEKTIREKLPALAEPGRQFPDVIGGSVTPPASTPPPAPSSEAVSSEEQPSGDSDSQKTVT